MFNSNPSLPEPEFLKELLQPLLEDFQYWFSRSQALLESQTIGFLGQAEQANLLDRLKQAQQEVSTAKLLLQVTDGRAGIDTAILVPWHNLVTECWRIGMRFRTEYPDLHPDS